MLFVGVPPVHQLNPCNGLANSRFHTLLLGISGLRSDEVPYFGAKHPCSAVIVQLLCNQKSTQNTTVYATVDSFPIATPLSESYETLAHPTPLGPNKFVDQTSNNR